MKFKLSLFVYSLILFTSFAFSSGNRIALIPWGANDNQFGLQSGPEIEPVGPLSFAIDSSDSIFFLDSINKRVSVFNKSGKFQKIASKNIYGSSISIANDGSFGVLDNNLIHVVDNSGKAKDISVISGATRVEGYGQHLRFHNNAFYATELNQKLTSVAERSGNQFLAVKGINAQLSGLPASSGETYTVDWRGKQLAVVKKSSGQELELRTNDVFGGLQIIGVDNKGNIFVELERITANNYVHLDLVKMSNDGKVIVTQEIPNLYSTTVYKKTELLSDGSVLQMVTTPQGVELWIWNL